MARTANAHRLLQNQRGQALIETAITISMVVVLTMGIIEFGRAFMVANMITNAARDGARAAAVISATERANAGGDSCGSIPASYDPITGDADPDNWPGRVKSQIGNVLADANALNVTIQQNPTTAQNPDGSCVVPATPVVTVTVSGTVPYIFNLPFVGTSFAVNRVATFRDEGR